MYRKFEVDTTNIVSSNTMLVGDIAEHVIHGQKELVMKLETGNLVVLASTYHETGFMYPKTDLNVSLIIGSVTIKGTKCN